jgi:hypothetical protein
VIRVHKGGGRCFEFVDPLTFRSHTGFEHTVRAGYRCDGASVPRIAAVAACLFGESIAAAGLHDDGYENDPGGLGKAFWDLLFYEALITEGVDPDEARRMYEAVSVFGWFAWWAHRARDRAPHPSGLVLAPA